MVSTPEYKFAKFLDSLIKPYLSDNHMLYSTENFLKKLNQFKIKADHKLIRFDVQSLFTNVPLDETIQITAIQITSFIRMTIAQNKNPHHLKKKFL